MNDLQENKYNMFLTVLQVCDQHQAAWSGFGAFAAGVASFDAKLDEISAIVDARNSGLKGATKDKAQKRAAMTDLAFAIGKALDAWALKNGHLELAAKIPDYITDFNRLRDTAVESMARTVHTEATENLASLADYGITQPLLDNLAAAITAYSDVLNAPQLAKLDSKAATAALDDLMTEADRILKEELDLTLPLIALTQPAFATAFQNARVIVDD